MKVSGLRLGELAPFIFLGAVVVAVAVGFWMGIAISVLLLAALAFALAIALLSSSVRGLSGGTPLSLDEAIAFGAPSAEEEQKRAVLRALKDLEYERSVGKISEEDYQAFSARYREEARRLMSAVDESMGGSRELAEKLLAARIEAAGIPEKSRKKRIIDDDEPDSDDSDSEPAPDSEPDSDSDSEPAPDPKPVATAKSTPKAKKATTDTKPLACPSCNAVNDADARFCKRCGAAVGGAETKSASAEPPREENLS